MALIISFQNQSNLDDVSDYKVDVWINDRHIDGPFLIKNHTRADGYKELVKRFAHFLTIREQVNDSK